MRSAGDCRRPRMSVVAAVASGETSPFGMTSSGMTSLGITSSGITSSGITSSGITSSGRVSGRTSVSVGVASLASIFRRDWKKRLAWGSGPPSSLSAMSTTRVDTTTALMCSRLMTSALGRMNTLLGYLVGSAGSRIMRSRNGTPSSRCISIFVASRNVDSPSTSSTSHFRWTLYRFSGCAPGSPRCSRVKTMAFGPGLNAGAGAGV